MKFKTTKKEITSNYCCVISAQFCSVGNLFPDNLASAYTCGVYGWNADVFKLDYLGAHVALVTGLRPFGSIEPDYALTKHYNDAAAGKIGAELLKLQKEYISAVLSK